MQLYTKASLIEKLKQVREQGFIESIRPNSRKNDGAVGNTLEYILGIEENNLPLPNAAEWELKCTRANTNSLITLLHNEPSPRGCKFVPNILLPKYGWAHQQAGIKYPQGEMSFRATLSAFTHSDRGFIVEIDQQNRKIQVIFDPSKTHPRHSDWLKNVRLRCGNNGQFMVVPYWGFDDIFYAVATKLHNCFFIIADTKKEGGIEYFHYNKFIKLMNLSQEKFLESIRQGDILIDFDARTGHNHGTKFRIREKAIINLYSDAEYF